MRKTLFALLLIVPVALSIAQQKKKPACDVSQGQAPVCDPSQCQDGCGIFGFRPVTLYTAALHR